MTLELSNDTGLGRRVRQRGANVPAVGLLATLLILAGCAGPSAARVQPTPAVTASAVADGSATSESESRFVCADGRLLIGDLPQMDLAWRSGIQAATAKASAWQPDARLTKLRVGCQLFEAGFRWQATFYSEKAQTFFASDTGETEPAEVAPEDVPTLPTDSIDFGLLRRSLAKSGYEDRDAISASTGVDVRLNTEVVPFGPPSAPRGVLIYHVAVEKLGETKDVFVDGRDGTVYRFTSP
ncbi:MAG: hypothetical protein QOF33_4011 [Thermomicrobiales bacterium]|nr:hypothetical protein [Thermomicrobiales bacterium]